MENKPLTAQEAYEIFHKKYPTERCRACLDYGNFFLFSFVPFYVDDGESYMAGTVFDAIDKKTKKIFDYDIASNPRAYEKAKNVHVETFMDMKVEDFVKKG